VQITNKLTYPFILSDQVICKLGLPFGFNEFKAKVNKKGNNSLCGDIYDTVVAYTDFVYITNDMSCIRRVDIDKKKYLSIAWWEDEESFINDRLPLYKQFLETFKKVYKYEPAK
jgi:hypothetical protein